MQRWPPARMAPCRKTDCCWTSCHRPRPTARPQPRSQTQEAAKPYKATRPTCAREDGPVRQPFAALIQESGLNGMPPRRARTERGWSLEPLARRRNVDAARTGATLSFDGFLLGHGGPTARSFRRRRVTVGLRTLRLRERRSGRSTRRGRRSRTFLPCRGGRNIRRSSALGGYGRRKRRQTREERRRRARQGERRCRGLGLARSPKHRA